MAFLQGWGWEPFCRAGVTLLQGAGMGTLVQGTPCFMTFFWQHNCTLVSLPVKVLPVRVLTILPIARALVDCDRLARQGLDESADSKGSG